MKNRTRMRIVLETRNEGVVKEAQDVTYWKQEQRILV